jgi:hypothetical protein
MVTRYDADNVRSKLGSPCLVDVIRSGFCCDIQYPSTCALVLVWWMVTRRSHDSHKLMNNGLEGWLETRTAEI